MEAPPRRTFNAQPGVATLKREKTASMRAVVSAGRDCAKAAVGSASEAATTRRVSTSSSEIGARLLGRTGRANGRSERAKGVGDVGGMSDEDVVMARQLQDAMILAGRAKALALRVLSRTPLSFHEAPCSGVARIGRREPGKFRCRRRERADRQRPHVQIIPARCRVLGLVSDALQLNGTLVLVPRAC